MRVVNESDELGTRYTELGTNTVCKNCGQSWGGHYFEYCKIPHSVDGSERISEQFIPHGVEIDTICAKCNSPFNHHYKHMYCRTDQGEKHYKHQIVSNNRFKPSIMKSFLPEELFEI